MAKNEFRQGYKKIMEKKVLFLIVIITLFSCQKRDREIITSKNTPTNPEDVLRFEDFQNTKWIIGEEGINGEKPDTILFITSSRLDYISTDTGKESCSYKFIKDTLVYVSHSLDFDMESDSDIECEYKNILFFKDNQFKYIYEDKKCPGNTRYERKNLEEYNIMFRKVM